MGLQTDSKIEMMEGQKNCAPLGPVKRIVSFLSRITTTYRRRRLYWRVWKATDIILTERHDGDKNKEFHHELNKCLDALEEASIVIKVKSENGKRV